MSAPQLWARRSVLVGALATPLAWQMACAQPRRAASLSEFGAVGDGRTDNAGALRAALAAVGPGGSLRVPAGQFLVLDRSIHEGAPPFRLPAGLTLSGEGARSVLRFRRDQFPSFYGLTIQDAGITIRDLTLEVDRAGSGWAAAAGIVGATRDLRFSNVGFAGVGGRGGHHGIMPIGADIDRLMVERCHFERLDFGFVRDTADTAIHRQLSFTDCVAEDCTEVFEINAPGLGFIETTAGSAVIERLVDEAGSPLSAERLPVGKEFRSAAFPAGTRIVGRDRAGRLIANRPALATAHRDRRARLSAGGASGGSIRNLVARNIGQWAVGLANCDGWDVEVHGDEVGYELVHIEDASRNIRVVAGGSRCNLLPGVVGSPSADNGMVHVSTGSSDISVRLDADLTANRGGRPVGLCVQPGGPMGTTGREVAPTGVTISGRVLLKEGTKGVVAYESGLTFDQLELINASPASRADPMMRLAGCTIYGSVGVRNPGRSVIQEETNRPRGGISINTI